MKIKVNLSSLLFYLLVALAFSSFYIKDNYLIGVDPQVFTSIQENRFYLAKKEVNKSINKGDIVVFRPKEYGDYIRKKVKTNDIFFAKKVIATQGQRIIVNQTETTVDNKYFDKGYENNEVTKNYATDKDILLEADEFFVMGNSSISFDSRYFGPINKNEIIAQVIFYF